ncbi:MAG: InlB B-repeat-containing protein [Lachnospiraceae bacterium]|nr:InlB B-repeat-containing protein [Lachnospiraceae bacterium]
MRKNRGIYVGFIFCAMLLIALCGINGRSATAAGRAYSISYKMNGGRPDRRSPRKYTAGKATKLYTPYKKGYTFKGWYADKKYKKRVRKITKSTKGNITLYAKWQLGIYNIEYAMAGGINALSNPDEYTYNTSIKLKRPTRTGFSFVGWYADSKCTKKVTSIPKGTTGDVKLFAKWQACTYRITYHLKGGINDHDNPSTYTYNKQLTLNEPVRDGFVFMGWYTEDECKNKITKIKKGKYGRIDLYARWSLEALNISSDGSDDMIWSWWYYPQVISYTGTKNRLYWGFATKDGYCGIASYNYDNKEIKKTFLKKSVVADDHNGMAITVMDDGRIMCVYAGGHNSDRDIHVRISNHPEDITKFSTETVLRSADRVCYSQIVRYKSYYYVFYRVANQDWAYRRTRNGIKWSDEKILVDANTQYYCRFVPTTDEETIRICMYSNPNKNDNSIRMGFFKPGTGKVYNADGKTILGETGVANTKFSKIIPIEEGKSQRMFDIAISKPEDTKVLYTVTPDTEIGTNSAYKLYVNGKNIDICEGGKHIYPKYQCGAAFILDNRFVVARNENGFDCIELYGIDGEEVYVEDSIYKESIGVGDFRNARPIVDIHGNALLWHRGRYSPRSYKDFETDAMLYLLE